MNNWVTMLDRIKAVREAKENFLIREYVDRSIIGPMLLDRLAADLFAAGGYGPKSGMPTVENMTPMTDDRYRE